MSSLDLLIRGGTVVSMDPEHGVFRGDLLVRAGAIAAMGRVRPRSGTRVLDATGCAVIPGLVQAHVHLCQALFRGMADDRPLLPWLRERIWPLEAAHDARSLRASARLGLAEMLLAGTTSILDMGTVHDHDVVFEAMREAGIRGMSGKAMMDRGRGLPGRLHEKTADSLKESVRLCERWHGAADGRLGYAFAPRFILSCSERLLRGSAEAARAHGALIHTHAAEHRAERNAVRRRLGRDDVEELSRLGIAGPDVVLAHGVQLTVREMRAMARRGTRVTHCPSANLKLASGIARVVEMRRAGIVVGLGADGAPCNNRLDPWTEMRQAALLAKVQEDDAAALSAAEALSMATLDGARVLGIDDRVGSLTPTKRADLAVVRLDRAHSEPGGDVIGRLVYSCTAADVRHVAVDGRIVVQEGELLTLDLDRVLADARRQARHIQDRAFG